MQPGRPLGPGGGLARAVCMMLRCSLGPRTQEALARPDWLLRSESGPVGETWVKKISFHQLPETLHLFSFGDCQCDNSQWKGCVCKWRKRIPEMQRQEGRCGWVSSGGVRPGRRCGRGERPQGVGGGGLASMEARTKALSSLLCLSSPSLFLLSLVA